ncbi:MAG: hypothetical protein KDA92_06700, partial [Planctomycetales bacterium]|nr:hypothetical protein [Planctomycetales bacterium]
HGGGNAPTRVNDRQWENQKGLYEPQEGVYLAPRAPTDTWNLWHEAHIDPLFDRLIEELIVFEKIDPNRVYLLGYSAGGDGVYQVAPRFADRLAAASMMAGHPNEARPLSLRNLPFTIHMGGDDGAYNRNEVARQWGNQLDELQKEDPKGYVHTTHIHEGKGHWMNREDAVAIEWLAQFTRNPFPDKIVWHQDDVTHQRFYWLRVLAGQPAAGWLVKATREGNTITIDSQLPSDAKIGVMLNDDMCKLDEPVTIRVNDGKPIEVKPVRTIATIAQTIEERGDPRSVYSALVPVELSE